jgi:hypothetical protein
MYKSSREEKFYWTYILFFIMYIIWILNKENVSETGCTSIFKQTST